MLQALIGQEYAVRVLLNTLVEGHVGGSFLFAGPPHVGKATAAREFGKAMLCDAPQPSGDACDVCKSCRAVAAGKHPDLRAVQPVGPSRILRIAQIWPRDGVKDFPPESALLHDLHFAPVFGRRRVFIVEDADALNEDTANSLLKALEEPPPYATFLLTAPSTSAVLPTINSRCRTVRFTSVAARAIEEALSERGLGESAADARFLAAFCQGRIGDAFAMAADPDLRTARASVLIAAMQISMSHVPIHALKLADDLRKAASKLGAGKRGDDAVEQGARQSAVAALEILALWYRDLLAIASGAGEVGVVNVDHYEALSGIASGHSPADLSRALELILEIRRCVERNANAQIAFEAMALRLITMAGPANRSAR